MSLLTGGLTDRVAHLVFSAVAVCWYQATPPLFAIWSLRPTPAFLLTITRTPPPSSTKELIARYPTTWLLARIPVYVICQVVTTTLGLTVSCRALLTTLLT